MLNLLKNGTVKRTVFALVILAIILPPIFITAFCGEGGRIAGITIFAIIGMIGIYEVLETIGFSKPVAILSTLIIPGFILLPWTPFSLLVKDGSSNGNFYDLMKMGIGQWQGWVLVLATSVVPLIVDQRRNKKVHWSIQQLTATLMFIIVPVFTKAIWVVNIYDWVYIFFFLPIAIISDTFAYFGGMLFGKKWFKGAKFAPKVSPKKTWAGFVIGTVATLIFAIIAGYYMHVWSEFGSYELLVAIIFGIFLSLISPYGDLLFSWFKRKADKKDYSNLIPGHGGIFDRLDAMSIVIVVSAILVLFAGLI